MDQERLPLLPYGGGEHEAHILRADDRCSNPRRLGGSHYLVQNHKELLNLKKSSSNWPGFLQANITGDGKFVRDYAQTGEMAGFQGEFLLT